MHLHFRGRQSAWRCRLGAFVWLAASQATFAQTLDIPKQHHAWARFTPGSWTRLRETTYAVDPQGQETTPHVTVTTLRLEAVGEGSCTLQRESRRDDEPPETSTVELGLDELPLGQDRQTKLSLGEIKINGKTYVCQTHEITSVDEEDVKTVTKWWYCPDQAPYLLKKIARERGLKPAFESTEVEGFQVLRMALGKEFHCTQFSVIRNTLDRSTKLTLWTSDDVPGGRLAYEGEVRDQEQQGLLERVRGTIEEFHVEELHGEK